MAVVTAEQILVPTSLRLCPMDSRVQDMAQRIELGAKFYGNELVVAVNHTHHPSSYELIGGRVAFAAFSCVNGSRSVFGQPSLPLPLKVFRISCYEACRVMWEYDDKFLSPLERADMIVAFGQRGWTENDIAALYGKTQPWVAQQHALASIPTYLRDLVAAKALKPTTAVRCKDMSEKQFTKLRQRAYNEGRKLTTSFVNNLQELET